MENPEKVAVEPDVSQTSLHLIDTQHKQELKVREDCVYVTISDSERGIRGSLQCRTGYMVHLLYVAVVVNGL